MQAQAKGKACGLDAHPARKRILDEVIKGTAERYSLPGTLRGIPVEQIERRGEGQGILGYECPLLSCEHRFSQNDGIIIHDSDGSITGQAGQVRLNNVVAHLATHGVSNNGEADSTQRYLTIREFLRIRDRNKGEKFDRNSFDPHGMIREIAMKAGRKALELMGISEQVDDDHLEEIANEILHFRGNKS